MSRTPGDSAGESFTVPTDEELEEFLCRSVSDELKAAMDALPPRFRLTLMLREIAGLSYQECADALEVPIGTVMSRLYRARRSLQEMLIPAVAV